jgi:hypothetical protein
MHTEWATEMLRELEGAGEGEFGPVAPPTQPAGAPPVQVDCTQPATLAGFEALDYRLRPRHFKPLREIGEKVHAFLTVPDLRVENLTARIVGRSDRIGDADVEEGVALARAREAAGYLTAWLQLKGASVAGLRMEVAIQRTEPPAPAGALNRRVEIRVLCDRPMDSSRATSRRGARTR